MKAPSPRDQVLYQMARSGWANASAGEVEASTGWFALVSNSPDDLPEVTQAFEQEIDVAHLTDVSLLIGHYLVVEATGGVAVQDYANDGHLKIDYAVRLARYERWQERQRGGAS